MVLQTIEQSACQYACGAVSRAVGPCRRAPHGSRAAAPPSSPPRAAVLRQAAPQGGLLPDWHTRRHPHALPLAVYLKNKSEKAFYPHCCTAVKWDNRQWL